MKNNKKRPGRCRASFLQKNKLFMKVMAIIMIVCIAVVPIICLVNTSGNKESKGEERAPEPIEIEIPEPRAFGTVSVYNGYNLIYEYSGDIEIINDGKDGEEMEIRIAYPEGTWPCSCMNE